MNGILREETIIEIEKELHQQINSKNCDSMILAKIIYSKFISPIREKLINHEKKYYDSYFDLNKYINDMMCLLSRHINEGLKEKDNRIEYLEKFIRENITEKNHPKSGKE
jgi:hypothetical protein